MPFNFLSKLIKSSSKSQFITVVSGLPRSGTSMMMQMLQADGLPILTDEIRSPDDDNPKGYLEFERVKKLKDGDIDWVEKAQGKAVKIISALMEYLPSNFNYKVIFMRRDIEEILASQKQMLIRRDQPTDKTSDEQLARLYQHHLSKVENWLAQQPNIETIYINYNDMMADLQNNTQKVVEFLDIPLDIEAMRAVPDKRLYRQKK